MTIETPDGESHKGGLMDSAKNLLATLLAMGQTRLEMFSTEIEEQREWLTAMLAWTLIALFSAALAVILTTLLVIVIYWDSHRLLAIGIMIGVFVLATAISWRIVWNMQHAKPKIFSGSISELSKDRELLSQSDESTH
jgi:uncharacterized membrane protein YqjE